MIGKSKIRGEIITITVALIGFAAACVPVIYGIYSKHKEYSEKKNEFIHSDVVIQNDSKYQTSFELASLDMKTGKSHSEFKITVSAQKEEQIPDWIEDQIKKDNKLVKAYFTVNHVSTTIQCPRLPLNEGVVYKLIETMGELQCEFSAA